MTAFRDRNGNRVEAKAVTATDAKNEFGTVLETALRDGAVVITKHDAPRAVLLSWEEYNSLVGGGAEDPDLAALTQEFERLYADMQSPRARKAADALLSASSADLGKAAVRAARASKPKNRRRG